MLTVIGLLFPTWLFVIGLAGVMTAVWPGITIVPRRGTRMKVASVILMIPLPLGIWWGTQTTESDRLVGELETQDGIARRVMRESTEMNRASGAAGDDFQKLVDGERTYLEQTDPLRSRIARRFENLDAYERCFDRLFFCIAALMIGWALVPAMPDVPTVKTESE